MIARVLLLLHCGFFAALAVPALAQPAAEQALAREMLRDLQPRSIRESREFCGMIGVTDQGRYVVGPIARGSTAECTFRQPRSAARVVASFHTHGGFLADYDNEVPSILDLEAERAQGTRGYVATPGGRFWLVDGVASTVTLICGPKCMPWDPRYSDGAQDQIRSFYTRQQLYDRVR